jgi:transposase-like protein
MSISDETKAAIRAALDRQATVYGAAKQAGCTESHVLTVARNEGIKVARATSAWEQWQDDLIANKANNGLTWDQLAQHTGKTQRQCINRGGTFKRRMKPKCVITSKEEFDLAAIRNATTKLHGEVEVLIAKMARAHRARGEVVKHFLFGA